MDKHELDALEVALKDATSGRWAMFHHGDGVYELLPAMRGGSVATGLNKEDALLIHLLKWHAASLIDSARKQLSK